MLFKQLCNCLSEMMQHTRSVAFYAIGIYVASGVAANNTENYKFDFFNYKHYIANDLYDPLNISQYSISSSYPVQIETQSDGYLIYFNNDEIIKIDKDRDIAWIKKSILQYATMRTFSNGSILLALSIRAGNNVEDRCVTYQLLDMNGDFLSGKVYWIDSTRMSLIRVISLETEGDSVFYSVVLKSDGLYSLRTYAIWKCNYSLDTIWTKEITVSDISNISFMKKCKTGNFLVGGADSTKRPMNILLDSIGNIIWSYSLDTASIQGKWTDGIELEDGSFIVAGFSDYIMIIAHISNDGRLINFKQDHVNVQYGKLIQLHDKLIFNCKNYIAEFDCTFSNFRSGLIFINNAPNSSSVFSHSIFKENDSDSLISFGSYFNHFYTACVGVNYPPQIVWNHPTINIRPGHVYIDTVKSVDTFPGDTVKYTLINKQNAPIIFDTFSGIISCVPFSKDTGNYSIEIVARDQRFQTDKVQFSLVIATNAVSTIRPKTLYSISPSINPTLFINIKQEIKANQAIDLLGREMRSITKQTYRMRVASGVLVKK